MHKILKLALICIKASEKVEKNLLGVELNHAACDGHADCSLIVF